VNIEDKPASFQEADSFRHCLIGEVQLSGRSHGDMSSNQVYPNLA
jgi:hypothetical protein